MDDSKKYSKFLSQLIADKFFLYGNHSKNSLVFNGIPDEQLEISGCARYDMLFNEIKNNEEKYILLMGSGMPSTAFSYFLSNNVILEWEKMITSVFAALKELNEEIIIKRHPTQNKEIIKLAVLTKKFLPDVKVYKNKNTYKLLSKSKVVVSMLSSVITEAIILDKPVVMPTYFQHHFGNHYTAPNAVLTIDKPEDALTVIKKALYDDKVKAKLKIGREKFIKENLEYRGKSTEKTLELIKEMLKK
jgi:UDP-N-acetylglucosamine 2-epimerase